MTVAELMSGTHDPPGRVRVARGAGGASLALGLCLLATVPALLDAAPYLAALGSAAALATVTSGCALWRRPTLVAWTVATLGSAAVLAGVLLELALGLPGTGGIPRLGAVESGTGAGLALLVLLLALHALHVLPGVARRDAEERPTPPYAL